MNTKGILLPTIAIVLIIFESLSSIVSASNQNIGITDGGNKHSITYQENATSISCDGDFESDGLCSYAYDGLWYNQKQYCAYGLVGQVSVYFNYTNPRYGFNRVIWQIDNGQYPPLNVSLPVECVSQKPLQLRVIFDWNAAPGNYDIWQCYNGNQWVTLFQDDGAVCEEGIYWYHGAHLFP